MYRIGTDPAVMEQVTALPAGQVVHLILEDQREVDLLLVQWWG